MHIDNPGVSRRYYDLVNEYKQADFFFLSFPKCGRTWVRYTLGSYFHYKYGVFKTHRLNSTHMDKMIARKKKGCPLVSFTHDYFSLGDKISKIEFGIFEQKTQSFVFENFYLFKPTIFLFRDPVDAVISFYYDDLRSKNPRNLSMMEWFKNKTFGLQGIIKWFDISLDLIEKVPNKLILSYENLKENQGWNELIEFTTNGVDPELLEKSINENKFDIAQKREKQNYTKDIKDNNKLFVRKGGSNYQESLPIEIKNYIDQDKNLTRIRKTLKQLLYV
jgi:hypothetical protein